MKADMRCCNCGREFADHDYVPDSITDYKCPVTLTEELYGYYHGGDPCKFYPDFDCCSDVELGNWQAACMLWNEAERRGVTPKPESCPSGWVYGMDGRPLYHVLRAPYGIGTYLIEVESYFDPAEETEEREAAGCEDEEWIEPWEVEAWSDWSWSESEDDRWWRG